MGLRARDVHWAGRAAIGCWSQAPCFASGRRVWVYWPGEQAVECVDARAAGSLLAALAVHHARFTGCATKVAASSRHVRASACAARSRSGRRTSYSACFALCAVAAAGGCAALSAAVAAARPAPAAGHDRGRGRPRVGHRPSCASSTRSIAQASPVPFRDRRSIRGRASASPDAACICAPISGRRSSRAAATGTPATSPKSWRRSPSDSSASWRIAIGCSTTTGCARSCSTRQARPSSEEDIVARHPHYYRSAARPACEALRPRVHLRARCASATTSAALLSRELEHSVHRRIQRLGDLDAAELRRHRLHLRGRSTSRPKSSRSGRRR